MINSSAHFLKYNKKNLGLSFELSKENKNAAIYGFTGAALGALGLLFVILGTGCIIGSVAAIFVAIKKHAGYKFF